MAKLYRWYVRALEIHPWKAQVLTTGFFMASGDVIAQTLIEKQKLKDIRLERVARFAFLGVSFVGPALRLWYLQLEKLFGVTGRTVGLKKMLVDQSMFAPCFIGCFLAVSGALQNNSWKVIKQKINQDYFVILRTNYMLWPAAQLITFNLIPLNYRVVFVGCVSLIWNTYLASQINKEDEN